MSRYLLFCPINYLKICSPIANYITTYIFRQRILFNDFRKMVFCEFLVNKYLSFLSLLPNKSKNMHIMKKFFKQRGRACTLPSHHWTSSLYSQDVHWTCTPFFTFFSTRVALHFGHGLAIGLSQETKSQSGKRSHP